MKLRRYYNIFLLSNTNEIHIKKFEADLRKAFKRKIRVTKLFSFSLGHEVQISFSSSTSQQTFLISKLKNKRYKAPKSLIDFSELRQSFLHH